MAEAEVQRTQRRETAPATEAAGHAANSALHSARTNQLQAIGTTLNGNPRVIAHSALGERLNGGVSPAIQRQAARPAEPNHIALPGPLKSGIEVLSGYSMEHVDVRHNSSASTQLRSLVAGARADAPGSGSAEITLATARPHIHVMQLRPADIFMNYSVPFHYDDVTDKDSYRGFRGQRTPHAAKGVNDLRKSGTIRTDPDQDFIGGHLLKAEYGGADSPKNVVPWSVKAERVFSGYEAGYSDKIKRYRQFAQRQGQINAQGDWTWPFYVAAEFEDWKGGGDERTQEVLSAIPSSVTVNPGSTVDFFHVTGTGISGRIDVQDGGGHVAGPAEVVAPVAPVESAKSKFKHNLSTCVSRVTSHAEETKHDRWAGRIVIFAMTRLEAMKEGLLREIGDIVDRNLQLVPVAPVVQVRTITHFTSSWRSGPSEHARREALDNPIALPTRTEDSVENVIDELITRYRQILINNLIALNQALADQEPEARKNVMRSFVEECFA